MDLKRKWLLTGGFGALLYGFGICCVIESAFYKHSGAPLWEWVVLGTVSLSILLTGTVLLIKAGILGQKLKSE
ncbi:hypothetical protein [Croceivirga thetidis]|uniref:DUF3955 domain-containing protein n=1 Tax=Croceivirga thetidis TaxID=2721623 RepID=A0ABX1GQZ6_9FLAO|nr:hypothetical protein [Croceivirga thetidis]NKI32362.1 hypothetical protein [Croceivirga thetidis]